MSGWILENGLIGTITELPKEISHIKKGLFCSFIFHSEYWGKIGLELAADALLPRGSKSYECFSISCYSVQRVLHIIPSAEMFLNRGTRKKKTEKPSLGEPGNGSVPGHIFSLPRWTLWGLYLWNTGRHVREVLKEKSCRQRGLCYLGCTLWTLKNCAALSESLVKVEELEEGKCVSGFHVNNCRALAEGWACQTRFSVYCAHFQLTLT